MNSPSQRRRGWKTDSASWRGGRPAVDRTALTYLVCPKVVLVAAVVLVAVLFGCVFAFTKTAQHVAEPPAAVADGNLAGSDGSVEDGVLADLADIDQQWRATAADALEYFGGDKRLVDLVMTMIYVESDGDENVDYYHDIMEAREGDTRGIIVGGLERKGIAACTSEASIYAGVAILVDACDDFVRYLGREPDPDNLNDMALLGQGYNYGHHGWFMWLQRNGINEWSLYASQTYQASIGGVGTANHGQKIMDVYQEIHW